MDQAERRRHPRVNVHVRATYRSGLRTFDGYVTNISQSGLVVVGDEVDGTGTPAEVLLFVPGLPDPLTLRCVVAWSGRVTDHACMGLRFGELSRELRIALANFVIARYYAP